MFELITHAYEILVNASSRKKYDDKYALSKQVKIKNFYDYDVLDWKQDNIKSFHEKIFDKKDFDLAKFNDVFDACHKNQNELILHQKIPKIELNPNFNSIDNYEDFIINISI